MANKGRRFPPEPLATGEVEAILGACGRRSITGRRNAAMIAVMWRAGLRANEARHVRHCDLSVDGEVGTLRIMVPKGAGNGKAPRLVGLDRIAMRWVQAWLASREQLVQVNGVNPLFCSRHGGILPENYLRKKLPHIARKAGIERRVHPHALRHSFAFDATMEGQPLPTIRKALGHTSLLTTQAYIDHLAPADVVAAMQERGQ